MFQTIEFEIVLPVLTRNAMPYPLLFVKVESWIVFPPPWIWTPLGVFWATTVLRMVALR